MIEAIVASLLNRYLGRYVKDLDSENVNVGIFSGKVELEDLRLRPEALVEFDLPVEVKAGNLGKVIIEIPWTNLYNQSVTVVLEDLLLLAGPISERPYNEEQEKQLNRASKQQKLEFLESTETFNIDETEHDRSFVEKLSSTIINNLQVFIRNVHIRYEDSISDVKSPLACGIVLHGLSVETTNKQWKPTQLDASANSIYKLIKLKSLSIYWNPYCDYHRLTGHELVSDSWINIMKQGLERFSVNNEEFDFIVKPISAKVKMIVNKSNEAKVPKLLLDFVLKDIDAQISRQQYLSFMNLLESFQRMRINQRYRRYRPSIPVTCKTSKWWKYAFNSVLEESIRPFAWKRIKQHRDKYHEYVTMYTKKLQNPADAEIKVDLQKLEDNLDLLNIVIAREQARLEFSKLEPENIHPKKPPRNWWRTWFFSRDYSKDESFEIVGERDRNVWHQLTAEDKQKIYDAVGYTEGEKFNDKPIQYIENKLNFTFANCTLSLKSFDKEILVTTLTQLLLSLETRPSANAFHFSARAESFIIEGSSVENDLAPIITADPVTSGTTMPHVLAIDFEKNPLHINADYGLSVHSESIEVVYHEHALTEVLTFLQAPTTSFNDVIDKAANRINEFVSVSRAAVEYAIETHKKIYLNLEMKSPHFIIPEYGNLQKGGSVIVMDFGHLTMKSNLQTDNRLLEDATRTELEERLYDRYNVSLSEIQVLFADSGDEWRTAKTSAESDSHLIPKFSIQVIFSNSVKPDYRQLPRHKLNISLPTVKLNLSDRRVKLLSEFGFNLPIPKPKVCYSSTEADDSADGAEVIITEEMKMSEVIVDPSLLELRAIRHRIQAINKQKETQLQEMAVSNISKHSNEKSSPTSDQSDEETEQWARIVDLPGFDDNVSPSNAIVMLLRFLIGEVVVQLARSSDLVDKPYLMLRIDKLCMDIALMECGPALQANIGAIQLVDKLHTGLSGEYLELIRSRNNSDVITILYRKVRSDCPDFKTYFHTVEQSVVIDFASVHLLFHRGAFLTLSNFLEYLSQRIGAKAAAHLKSSPVLKFNPTQLLLSNEEDPPVPPGATKLSISARLDEIKMKLCDSDVDFLEIQLAGVEIDFILKANEKFILRAQLTTLEIDDLSDLTLYPKILTIKDDKVFDFKYVRHSSSHHKQQGIEHSSRGLLGDANLRLKIGKIHITMLHKFIANFQRFLEPFIHPHMTANVMKLAECEIQHQVKEIRNQGTKILVSVDIQIPTILIPQKSDSPSVLVVSLGNLTMENFFHEVVPAGTETKHIVDNLLIRLNSIEISRALIGLNGATTVQELILEPTKLRLDVKRAVTPYHRDVLLYDVQGSLETAKLNVGQKDVRLFYGIFKENFTEGRFVENHHPSSHPSTPIELVTPTIAGDDSTVKRLQAFLNYSCDLYKEMACSFTLEGLRVQLFTDADNENDGGNKKCGLSSFNMEEVMLSFEAFSDKSIKMKCALQAIMIRDTRPESHLAIRKIFQSYSGDSKVDMGMISLSMPPMIDVTYKVNPAGDVEVDVLIEKTRLNVSIPYLLAVMKFLYDSIPIEKPADGGIINPGFTEEMNKELSGSHVKRKRQISISESTSGYHSTSSSALDDVPAISLTAKLKKPEIILFADPNDKHSRVLVIKTDAFLDYNRNATQDNLVASIANLQILSCVYGRRRQTAYRVLKPCDIEFSRLVKSVDEGVQMTALLSYVDFRLSASTVHTVIDIFEELAVYFKPEKGELESSKIQEHQADVDGLWTPQKINSVTWMKNDPSDEKYEHESYPQEKPQENLTVKIPEVVITCELESATDRIPVLQLKTSMEADVNNWSKQMFMKSALRLELSYYNQHLNVWEPLIEPVMQEENVYRPWEVLIKMFQQPAHPIALTKIEEDPLTSETAYTDYASTKMSTLSESDSSGNETESEPGMMIIKRPHSRQIKRVYAQKSHDSNSVVGCRVDSDSENEEGILDKIADAFGHMFTSDSSEDEPSESEDEVIVDAESDAEETDTADPEASIASEDARPVFLRKEVTNRDDETDSGVDDLGERLATYVLIDARDKLDITLTPTAADTIRTIVESFTQKHEQQHYFYKSSEPSIELHNKIGPQARISIIEKTGDGLSNEEIVRQTSVYEDEDDDLPVGPASTALLVDVSPAGSDIELEDDEVDRFSISSALDHVGCADINEQALVYEETDISTLYTETTRQRITIEVNGFDKLQCILQNIESSHVYPLHPSQNDTCYHVIVDVAICYQQKSVSVRSPLQIHNSTNHPLNLYYKRVTLEALKLPHPVQPKNPFDENICLATLHPGELYSIPLFIAYHCKLYVQPAFMNYAVSSSGIWWQEISVGQNNTRNVHCPANDETQPGFHMKVSCQEGVKLRHQSSSGTRYLPNFKITVHPPLVIHNQLPYEVELKFQNFAHNEKLDPGNRVAVYNIDLHKKEQVKVEVSTYLGIPWNGTLELSAHVDDDKSVTMLTDYDTEGGNKQLGLNVHVENENSLELFFYAPYWIVNKTGLPLQFRGTNSDMVYESQTTEEPLLFRFKRHRRKRVRVRVYNSHWSSAFSLDTVGSSGVVICKDKERNKKYQFLLNITHSKLHLTKIVTIAPYYIVVNKTRHYLRYMEENVKADLWFDIAPNQVCSYWPDTDSSKMLVKYRDSDKVSQHFPLNIEHSTVLRMDRGTAMCVDVHGGLNSPILITFFPYTHGEAPVRIDNMCEDIFLKIHQKSMGQVMLLSPYQSMLYTWDDPTVERTLFWNVYNRNKPGLPIFLNKDGFGHEKVSFHTVRQTNNSARTNKEQHQSSSDEDDSENGSRTNGPRSQKTRKDKVIIYWVSYLDGHQRTILFTQDEALAKSVNKVGDIEKSWLECFVSFQNVGVSLVNGVNREIAYLSLSGSPAIWEVDIGGKWKLLSVELSTWLEDKWRADQLHAQLKDYIQVNLSKMQMTKPFFGQLRRKFYPALWLQYRQSVHQSYFHLRLHRFQIDNQLQDAIFPIVLHPSPIPFSITKKSGSKPFVELVMLQRHMPELNFTSVKYLKALVQEFHFKLDKGFLLSLHDMISSSFLAAVEDTGLKADLTAIHSALKTGQGKIPHRSQRTVFEYVHLCPLKIIFSFSPRGIVHKETTEPKSWQKDFVNFFTSSVGATLSEMKDVELKMTYFEKKGVVVDPRQMLSDVRSHYKIELVQQVYVLIFGLDILGNPYGLVKDFMQGFGDFFYEPWMGSIKRPEEYAEAISFGAQSLLGHVVGGTAGSVSLITGSLGQTLAMLSCDEDYKQRRRMQLQPNKSLPDAIATAGKTFALGVALGISGIFTKPVTGAQLEGVEGFFKGIGKGLLGILVKPAGGVIDMVSMAFDGIRRIAEMGEDVIMQSRLPRYLNSRQGIRPYSPYTASGNRLLQLLSRGHYSENDTYFAHAALRREDCSDVVLITDRHVFLLEKSRFWGGWDIEWIVRVDDIMAVPKIGENNLVITIKQDESFNMYSKNEQQIACEDPVVLEWLADKIEKVLLYNMADKPCPSMR